MMVVFLRISQIILFSLFISGYLMAKTDVTIYCDDSYPPYSYKEDREIKGIYTEVVKVAFSRMEQYKVKIKAIPWKRGLKHLEEGKGFGIYPPYYHIRKRPYIYPYSLPILEEQVVLFLREDVAKQKKRHRWPEDYYGLTIANNAGFQLGGEKFWKAVKDGKIKVQEAKGNRANILKTAMSRVDGYMNDRLSIMWEIKKMKKEGIYKKTYKKLVEDIVITTEQGFIGFTDKDKGKFHYKDDFIKDFNYQIYNMNRVGEIKRIIDDYIK